MAETLDRAYCTVNQVKQFIVMSTSTTTYDDLITLSINRASRYIDSMTKQLFHKKTYTSVYLGDEFTIYPSVYMVQNSFFTLPHKPVISLSIVDANNTALVENTHYRILDSLGQVESLSGAWDRTYRVTCELGIDETDEDYEIPGDINYYCVVIASVFSGLWKRAVVNEYDGRTENFIVTKVPDNIVKELKNWKWSDYS